MSVQLRFAIVAAALGAGLMGGFIFAFTEVMRALAHLPAADGMTPMQEMNHVVVSSL